MPNTLTLDVCKTGVLKSLQDFFTSPTTFINEALQNARRAGATVIDLRFDPETFIMTIQDNGCGLTNFRDLLTIGQSGWDPNILETEHPFGIGATAMLFAATDISIESHQHRLTFKTADILEGASALLAPHPTSQPGTIITLHLKPDRFDGLNFGKRIQSIVQGFPLPVTFNERLLLRPDAITPDYIETEIGSFWIGLPGTLPKNITLNPTLYLQGFPVNSLRHYQDGTILHLDPQQFRARVPDRTTLIEDPTYTSLIKSAIQQAVKTRLLAIRHTQTNTEFVDSYATTCRNTHNEDLLNNLPLPLQDCLTLTTIPSTLGCGEGHDNYLDTISPEHRPLSPTIPLSHPITTTNDISWDEDALPGAYALAMNYLIVENKAVPPNHWLHPQLIPLSDYQFTLTPLNPRPIKTVDTFSQCDLELILCDSLTLTPSSKDPRQPVLPPVTLDTHFIFSHQHQAAYFPIPAIDGNGSYWELLRQINHYENEHDQYDEAAIEEDEGFIADLVRMTRHDNPITLLVSVLNNMPNLYKDCLRDQRFLLHINTDHTIDVIPHDLKKDTLL